MREMSNAPARRTATTSHGWLLALALIVGIVLMHSLMSAPAASGAHDMSDSMASSAKPHPVTGINAISMAPIEAADDPMGHGGGSMPDCGGLMIMCLALLVSSAALAVWRRGISVRMLGHRPRLTLAPLGAVREAIEVMTPRQRTAVIRC